MRELLHVSRHPWREADLVVVDDARLFNGTDGYPTIEVLLDEAQKLGFSNSHVMNDMIVLRALNEDTPSPDVTH